MHQSKKLFQPFHSVSHCTEECVRSVVGWADARLGKALCFSQGGELYPTVTDPLEDISQGVTRQGSSLMRIALSGKLVVERDWGQ